MRQSEIKKFFTEKLRFNRYCRKHMQILTNGRCRRKYKRRRNKWFNAAWKSKARMNKIYGKIKTVEDYKTLGI